MGKIFRKTRQHFLSEGKTIKYLKYAVGEIALVVIGILIALGINNRNQRIKNEEKITSILKEIQSDILIDLEASNEIFNFHMSMDSISKNILNSKYTLEDLRTQKFKPIGYRYQDFKTIHNGFDNLTDNLDKIPEKYKHVLPEIKNLYVTLNTTIDVYNKKMRSVVYENSDEQTNFNWYQDYLLGKENNEVEGYYLNNIEYKKLVARYMVHRKNIFQISTEYRIKAIDLYLKINEAIKSTDKVPEIVNYNNMSPNEYAGVYTLKETGSFNGRWPVQLKFIENNDQLVYIIPEINLELTLLCYNENTFFYNHKQLDEFGLGFLIFDKPEKGHFYISNNINNFAIYEKIESN